MSTPDGNTASIEVSEVDEALSPAPRLLPLRKLASSSIVYAFFLAFQSVVFLVFTRVAFRTLGAELYGLWTVLFAVQTVSVVATFGIPQAATKYAAQFGTRDSDSERLGEIISATYLLLLGTACAAAVGVVLARHYAAAALVPPAHRDQIAISLTFVAVAFVPTFIHQGSRALLLARFRNGIVGFLDLAQSLAIAIGVIILARSGTTPRQLALWILVVATGTAILSAALLYGELRGKVILRVRAGAIRSSLDYGLFAWIAVLGSMLFDGGDRLLVSHLLGPSLAGAYGIGTGVAMRLTQLNTPATLLLSPFVSSHEAGNQLDTVARALRLTNRAVGCLLALAGALLLLWSREILTIWISPAFAADYNRMFTVLVLVYATFSMAGPGYQTLLGLGRVRLLAVLGMVGSIGTLAIMTFLAPGFGVLGAAFANAAYLTVLVACFAALSAVGQHSVRTFVNDVGLPIASLYFAAGISLLGTGALTRTLVSAVVILALGLHAWTGLRGTRRAGRGS